MLIFIEYPPCSTCQKAKKFLKEHHIEFTSRHIVENTPTVKELTTWIYQSQLPIKKFFNTSGMLYREMQLKDKLETMSDEEKITLLSQHGMLIKRPLLISDNLVFVGFKKEHYESLLK